MSGRRVRVMVLAGSLALLSTACGGSGDGDGDGKPTASSSGASVHHVFMQVSMSELVKDKSVTLRVTTGNGGRPIKDASLELSLRTEGMALPEASAFKIEHRDGEKGPWKRLSLTARGGSLRGNVVTDVPAGTLDRWWRITPAFGPTDIIQAVKLSGVLRKGGEKFGESTWREQLHPVTIEPRGRSDRPKLSSSGWSEYAIRVRNLLARPLTGVKVEAELSCEGEKVSGEGPCDAAEGDPLFEAQYFDGDGWRSLDIPDSPEEGRPPNRLVLEDTEVPAKGEREYRFRLRAFPPLGERFDSADLGLGLIYPKVKKGQLGLLEYDGYAGIPIDAP